MKGYVIIPGANPTLCAKGGTAHSAYIVLNRKFIPLLLLLALAGCRQMPDLPTIISPYKIDVQQGNVVTQDMVDKLKPGMSRSQVRFALGSPLIVDPFRTDRWDYVYTYQKQGRPLENRRIVVIFQEDKLLRVEGDVVPQNPAAQKQPGAKPAAIATPAVEPDAAGGGAPKTEPAKAEASKDGPREEKGFFGRMLEKIGL